MKTRTAFSICVLCALCGLGCFQPAPPAKPDPPATPALPDAAPTLHLRIVRVDPSFSDALLQERIDEARLLDAEQGVRLSVTEIVPLDRPEWLAVTQEDLPALREYAGREIQTAYAVHSIVYAGEERGGLTYARPENCLIVSANSCVDVLAHELGHACGLVHRDQGCNTMRGDACCSGSAFDPDQGRALAACASDKSFNFSRPRAGVVPFVCAVKEKAP